MAFTFIGLSSGAEKQPMKLNPQQIHVLKLIARDCDENGWVVVSDKLFPVLAGSIPKELACFESTDAGGRACLTKAGENLIMALEWIQYNDG